MIKRRTAGTVKIWGGMEMDNRQALGYMLLACKELGYTKEQARKIYKAMCYQFDLKTELEAEDQGHEWYYSLED